MQDVSGVGSVSRVLSERVGVRRVGESVYRADGRVVCPGHIRCVSRAPSGRFCVPGGWASRFCVPVSRGDGCFREDGRHFRVPGGWVLGGDSVSRALLAGGWVLGG